MKKLVFALAALTASVSVPAAQWGYIGDNMEERTITFVNLTDISKAPFGKRFWVASVNKDPALKWDMLLVHYEFDCRKKAFRTPQYHTYLRGKIQETEISDDGEWQYIIPDTTAVYMHEAVCRKVRPEHVFDFDDYGELTKFGQRIIMETLREQKR